MSIRQRNAHFTDWAAVCRALNVATESEARTALESSDNTFYYYVCYIKSTKEIYTHGQFYKCSGGNEELLNLIDELTDEISENEEVTAKALSYLNENKASRGEIPTKISQLTNDSNYITKVTPNMVSAMGFTKNVGTITEVKMNGASVGTSGVVDLGNIPTKKQFDEQTEMINSLNYDVVDLTKNKQDTITDLAAIREGASKGATAIQPSSLATVATSGSYNDLSDKPTIPDYDSILDMGFLTEEDVAVVATTGSYNNLSDKPDIPTESTVSGWGFTKNTGTYSKPSGGIPKTDLTSDVQSALDNANNAVQREQFGNMEIIQIQGFEGALSGKLYALPDEATGDEDETLLSTHNVKTINGQSIFGKGNISIEGGGSGTITEVKMNGVSKGTSGVIDLGNVITDISGKQDVITDLAAIRDGASKGATAVQPSDIPEEAYLADFTMFSLRQGMNNGSQVTCDMNSLIEAMAANKTILVREDEASDGFKGVYVLNGYAEDLLYFSIIDQLGDILYCEGVDYTNTSTYIDGRTLHIRRWDDKVDSKALSAVATSGSYNDLSDRPTIPSAVTEATISGWGFTKNTGTISGITIYGQEVGTSGVVELQSGLQPLLSSYIDSEELEIELNKKQDILISGKNICTVDGKSLLDGSDIPFKFVPRSSFTTPSSPVYHVPANTKFNFSLSGSVAGFVLDCESMQENKDNTWLMSFKTEDTLPTISISISDNQYSLKWANSIAPVFEPNTCYELTFKLIGDCICGVCGVFY